MSKRWPDNRRRDDEESASTEVSRLIAMGFLVAAILGFAIGIGWIFVVLAGR